MADAYLNTTKPLVVPMLSTDIYRLVMLRDATLLLGENPQPGWVPSPFADSMLMRLVTLSRSDAGFNSPAFSEAASMLGAYIRRLENVVQVHAHCPGAHDIQPAP